MKKILKAAWFATKVGIGGGVVYVTVDQGIWGDGHRAAAVYDRLYDIMPGTKSVSEKYLHLPKKDDVNVNFRSYWNTGVFYTFDFIANLPTKVVGIKDSIVDFASSPPVSAKQSEEHHKRDGAKLEESHPKTDLPEEIVASSIPHESVDLPLAVVKVHTDGK
nr:MICOS complex subunit MIC13-like [Procambarus clarkii]